MRNTMLFLIIFFSGHHFGHHVIDAADKVYHFIEAEIVDASR